MTHPTPDQIASARKIVANPADHSPLDRSQAFATLKEAQGAPVDLRHVPGIPASAPEPMPTTLQGCLERASPRIRTRIMARARLLGLTGPDTDPDAGPEGAA